MQVNPDLSSQSTPSIQGVKPLSLAGRAEKAALGAEKAALGILKKVGLSKQTWEYNNIGWAHDNIEHRTKTLASRGITTLSGNVDYASLNGILKFVSTKEGVGKFLAEKAPAFMGNRSTIRETGKVSSFQRFLDNMWIRIQELMGSKELVTSERILSQNSSYGGATARLMQVHGEKVDGTSLANLQLINGFTTQLDKISEPPKMAPKASKNEGWGDYFKRKGGEVLKSAEHAVMGMSSGSYTSELKGKAEIIRGFSVTTSKPKPIAETLKDVKDVKKDFMKSSINHFIFTMCSEGNLTGHSVFVDLKNMTIDDMDTGVHSYLKLDENEDPETQKEQKAASREDLYAALQSKAKGLGYNMAKIEYKS